MIRSFVIASAVLAATSATAFAHSNAARQTEINTIIEQGRDTGTITWREGRKLRKEQLEIDRVKADLESDGKLSKADQRILHRLQDQSEGHIVAEANDGWRRLRILPRFGY